MFISLSRDLLAGNTAQKAVHSDEIHIFKSSNFWKHYGYNYLLIYLFPQDRGWGDQANFIISSSQKGEVSSGASNKLVYPHNHIRFGAWAPWALGAADRRGGAEVSEGSGSQVTLAPAPRGLEWPWALKLPEPQFRPWHTDEDQQHTLDRVPELGRQLSDVKVTTSSKHKHRLPSRACGCFQGGCPGEPQMPEVIFRSSQRQTRARVPLAYRGAGTSENTTTTSRGPLEHNLRNTGLFPRNADDINRFHPKCPINLLRM